MASPLPMGHGFVSHIPSPAGDIEYEKYFDFAAWERDQGNGVTRSSEGSSSYTPALTTDSMMTPPSEHSDGFLDAYYNSGLLNSLPDVRQYDDDWTYPHQDPSQDAFPHEFSSLMLNSSSSASSSSPSSSSSSSYSSSPPRYSSSSPPSSAASPPSYPPSPPAHRSSSPKQHSRKSSSSSSSKSSSSKSSKKRHLQHPEQTAEVRENGACIKCRIRRVRVSAYPCSICTIPKNAISQSPPFYVSIQKISHHATS